MQTFVNLFISPIYVAKTVYYSELLKLHVVLLFGGFQTWLGIET